MKGCEKIPKFSQSVHEINDRETYSVKKVAVDSQLKITQPPNPLQSAGNSQHKTRLALLAGLAGLACKCMNCPLFIDVKLDDRMKAKRKKENVRLNH